MAGLILLTFLVVLIAFLVWLSGLLTRRLSAHANWKVFLRFVFVVGAFSLMVTDEIIGKQQFETLCKTRGVDSVDVSSARGKSVRRISGERLLLKNNAIPIKASHQVIIDESTKTKLLEYEDYYANGGWLMRYTWLSMGYSRPMLFNGNGCGLSKELELFRANKIHQVN